MDRKIAIFLFVGLLWTAQSFGANGLTTGALTLNSTFENISVKAAFTGDDNANSTALVQYRITGSMIWINAYTPYIDHRTNIVNGVNSSSNPYTNQARVSIVGLIANTSYDVQITWTDGDGITGSNPVSGTISTLSLAPNFGGSFHSADHTTVNGFIGNGGTAIAGDTITLTSDTYSAITIGVSGTANAWIKIQCAPGATISGTGSINVTVSASIHHVYFIGCELLASDTSAIYLNANVNHFFIVSNTIDAVSGTCASDSGNNFVNRYGDAGIYIPATATDIYALSNTINAGSALSGGCNGSPTSTSPGTGISYTGQADNTSANVSTYVFCDNTVTGGFRDAISSDSGPNRNENVDQCRNTVTGYKDDANESKGSNVNVRLWGNSISAPDPNLSSTCIAANTTSAGNNNNQIGPLYIFRNTCNISTNSSRGQQVFKIGGAPTYLFHNSVSATGTGTTSAQRWDGIEDASNGAATNANVGQLVALNNIMATNGKAVVGGWSPNSIFNYNLYKTPGVTSLVQWAGSSQPLWSQFQADSAPTWSTYGSVQEVNGLCNPTGNPSKCQYSPGFLDAALHIDSTSPASNAGIHLDNFNGPNTAYDYSTANPSIGASEANPGSCIPDHLVFTAQPSSAALGASLGTVAVSVVNASGTLCPTATNSITLAKHSGATWGTLGSGSSLTKSASSGVAIWTDLLITVSGGSGAIDATATGLILGTSNSFTISSCTPDHLAFTAQPSSANVGATLGTVSVAIKDAGGITCTSATMIITIAKDAAATFGAIVSNASTSLAVISGVATWTDLYSASSGLGSIDAIASGLTSAISNPITISNVVTSASAARKNLRKHAH